jgi:hypothetical protein
VRTIVRLKFLFGNNCRGHKAQVGASMSWRRRLLNLLPAGPAVPLAAVLIAALSGARAADVPAPTVQAPSRAAAPAQAESAADLGLPRLQPGNWQYQRSVISATGAAPRQATISKCADPSQEMRGKLAELKQKGCRFSPTTHTGNSYSTSWTCPARGTLLVMTQVITVTSDSSYEDSTEARLQEQVMRTKIVATRVGECSPLAGVPRKHRPRPPPIAPSSGGG